MITNFKNLTNPDDLPPNHADLISYEFEGETVETRWGDREVFERMISVEKGTVLTKLQFRNLFPQMSMYKIDNFEDAAMGFDAEQVRTLRTISKAFEAATSINLTDPMVGVALSVFLGYGIITEAEQSYILANGV